MCSTLNNNGLQGLVTLLKYLTTKANNYWKKKKGNLYSAYDAKISENVFHCSWLMIHD